MHFNIAVVLAVATSAMAAVIHMERKTTGNATTCDLVLVPQTAVPETANLLAEFNGFFVTNIFEDPRSSTVIDIQNSTWTQNADGSFNVADTFSLEHRPAALTATIVEGWVGQVKTGEYLRWLVQSAHCVF